MTFFKHLFRHSCTLEVSTHHLGFQTYGIFTTLLMQDLDGYKKIYQPNVRTDLDGPRHIRFMHGPQQQNAYQQSHVAALLIHPSVLHKYCEVFPCVTLFSACPTARYTQRSNNSTRPQSCLLLFTYTLWLTLFARSQTVE